MGRIFVVAADPGAENQNGEPGAAIDHLTASQTLPPIRDLIVQNLQSHHYDAVAVPAGFDWSQAIAWLNVRSQPGDSALALQTNQSANPDLQGTTIHCIASNDQRKAQAELVLQALLRRVPQLSTQGAKPDTQSALGSVAFCRQVTIPSLVLELGYLSNPGDRKLMQTEAHEIALGIAEGAAAWSRSLASPPPAWPTIRININGAIYEDEGILVAGNPYIPADLADQLGLDLPLTPIVRRLSHRNIVYVRAVDLREANLSVNWDDSSRTVKLRSALTIHPNQIEQIMGRGTTSEVQLMMFLKSHNPNSLTQFPDLPRLYREEAILEGVNYDIAVAQMCLETQFLRFGGPAKPEQHNFAGLGAGKGGGAGASFSTARLGVRAHIQHLKAYASSEPFVQAIVDPRFQFVRRGVAPRLDQLSGRWSADPNYGSKIKAIARLLYEFADFL